MGCGGTCSATGTAGHRTCPPTAQLHRRRPFAPGPNRRHFISRGMVDHDTQRPGRDTVLAAARCAITVHRRFGCCGTRGNQPCRGSGALPASSRLIDPQSARITHGTPALATTSFVRAPLPTPTGSTRNRGVRGDAAQSAWLSACALRQPLDPKKADRAAATCSQRRVGSVAPHRRVRRFRQVIEVATPSHGA
jgi:hypothetical protein